MRSDPKKQLGQAIRATRLARGISTLEFARRVGIADRVARYMESGDHAPYLTTLVTIADVLGIKPSTLLRRAGL